MTSPIPSESSAGAADRALTSKMPIRIFSTDIDGTLVGKPDALARFNYNWKRLPDDRRPLLCYNTGRMLEDMLELIEENGLLEPDYMICGVGTLIYDASAGSVLKSFNDILEESWDRDRAEKVVREILPEAKRQPEKYQTRFKSSWHLPGATEEQIHALEEGLEAEGLDVNVIYSSDRDLDILPKYANKGNAFTWLLRKRSIPRKDALVAGDTGNDAAMFVKRGIRGIVVGNAQPELLEATVGRDVYHAQSSCADGVLEGLVHYGALEAIEEPPEQTPKPPPRLDVEPDIRRLLDEIGYESLSAEDLDYLRLAYGKAVDGLKKCITPLGFAACSPEDNVVDGTDQNYRSVWARDGSIAVIGSLSLQDDAIAHCQKQTLETLLDHISLTGQVPANVSIDSQSPDYSGVGGICSLDSGIWLIIACFEYARERGDLDFLRDRRGMLQRVMDWLSAHDANNDGLLEIPEAGDWTDLFGRSYNVLYDEVLWYRANICFGRILEMLGDWRRAGDYLRWASSIKSSILTKFWPSTKTKRDGFYTFADNQASIGDTHYLLAQVTPFDFDWRCDVFGNVLAFLLDVLDYERARKAFAFMWGVGVSDPYPVVNLYPPVQSGDPGWRNYYIVNLLNLPNHYHNGGVWPFVGAQWARFIYKLGFKDLAGRELLRLAKLNQMGVYGEWEFNEWAHGKNGRPMGKSFQAWSCSEFIRACHVMNLV